MATVPIVTLNASVVQAPNPSTLQQTGALVTQGGTNTAPGTSTLVSSLAQLLTMLAAPLAVSSITWSGSVVTVTTAAPHGWTNADVIPVTLAGFVPLAYNGAFTGTVTGASTLTYPLASNPGAETTLGTVALGAVGELHAMATTYFAGNGVVSVNVLDLGEGVTNAGVAALTTYIANVKATPQQNYSYMVPREWDNNAAFLTLCNNSTATNAFLYFYVTTTVANETVYSVPGYKCVFALVEAQGVAAAGSEFSVASPFGVTLAANPSSTNRVPPLAYAPSFGTTAYPLKGNQAVFQGLANASVGWIGTGQQGGISGNVLEQGLMSDGNFWNFWYSTDWAQINFAQAIANEVINGAASSVNPLYYNQPGIDRLQNRVLATARQGVAAGLGNGQVVGTKLAQQVFLTNRNNGLYDGQIVINAEPFLPYTRENPNDYGKGKYGGLSCVWIPQLPFLNIFFNLQSTTLISG